MGLNVQEDENIFKTINGQNKFSGKLNIKMRIHKRKKNVELFVVNDTNFEYDILLGLDLI